MHLYIKVNVICKMAGEDLRRRYPRISGRFGVYPKLELNPSVKLGVIVSIFVSPSTFIKMLYSGPASIMSTS